MLNPVDDWTRDAMVSYRMESSHRVHTESNVIADIELTEQAGNRLGVIRRTAGVRLIQAGAWLSGAKVRLETGNQGC